MLDLNKKEVNALQKQGVFNFSDLCKSKIFHKYDARYLTKKQRQERAEFIASVQNAEIHRNRNLVFDAIDWKWAKKRMIADLHTSCSRYILIETYDGRRGFVRKSNHFTNFCTHIWEAIDDCMPNATIGGKVGVRWHNWVLKGSKEPSNSLNEEAGVIWLKKDGTPRARHLNQESGESSGDWYFLNTKDGDNDDFIDEVNATIDTCFSFL